MKRYLLFARAYHEEGGGWADFIRSYDDLDKARTDARLMVEHRTDIHGHETDEAHVVDLETERVVSRFAWLHGQNARIVEESA